MEEIKDQKQGPNTADATSAANTSSITSATNAEKTGATNTNATRHSGTTNILKFYHVPWVPKLTAIAGLLAIGILYAFLPEKLLIGPNWLLLSIEVVLLLPVVFSWITGHWMPYMATRTLSLIVLGFATLALAISIILLINTLVSITQPGLLLRTAGLLWSCNVLIFGLWYWEVDGGGPRERHLANHEAADFMFPQQVGGNTEGWMPFFFDYLFLAFTGATAFSPTDTYPMTRLAKLLMMLESILSLLIVAILIGRVANIF